jgi:predicted amidophosphoribosyltransferase
MSWRRSTAELVTPRPGPGVCVRCFNLVSAHTTVCRACLSTEPCLERMVPISYSIGGGRLHTELAAYKRDADPFVTDAMTDLVGLLNGFISRHELCVGGGRPFDLITTVPSGEPRRDCSHPLRRIVAELVPATCARHERLLRTGSVSGLRRSFDPRRFDVNRPLGGERVLLIDDTWATGTSAQSAASALVDAGAGSVSAVVIGRYLRRSYGDNPARVNALAGGFDWNTCALCGPTPSYSAPETAKPAATRGDGGLQMTDGSGLDLRLDRAGA